MVRNEDDFRIRSGKVRDRGGGQITERRIGSAGDARPTSSMRFNGRSGTLAAIRTGTPTPGRAAAGSTRAAGARSDP
jgi:hypothetical protein